MKILRIQETRSSRNNKFKKRQTKNFQETTNSTRNNKFNKTYKTINNKQKNNKKLQINRETTANLFPLLSVDLGRETYLTFSARAVSSNPPTPFPHLPRQLAERCLFVLLVCRLPWPSFLLVLLGPHHGPDLPRKQLSVRQTII